MQVEAEVVSSRPLTSSSHCISVRSLEEFRFEPGQHVMVRIETSSGPDDRFLSIASAPSDEHLDFGVRNSESDFKQAFRSLKKGDRVRLIGPRGRFIRDPERPAVLLSGGIGITPLRSMLRAAVHQGDLPHTVLIFGNRDPREIPFYDELIELATHDSVRVLLTVDYPNDSWLGSVGRIGSLLVEEALRDLQQAASFYLCGPPAMVEALSGLLAGLGIEDDDILYEHFTGY